VISPLEITPPHVKWFPKLPKQQLTAVVSDSMCGAQHMAKDKTAAECSRECVKSGSKYALVVGGQSIYAHPAMRPNWTKPARRPR
jgi:hypothetical protein